MRGKAIGANNGSPFHTRRPRRGGMSNDPWQGWCVPVQVTVRRLRAPQRSGLATSQGPSLAESTGDHETMPAIIALAVSGVWMIAVLSCRLPSARTAPWSSSTLSVHAGPVLAVAVDPASGLFATGSVDRSAKVWDRQAAEPIAVLAHPGWVGAVAFSPDGTILATGCDDGAVRLWNTGNWSVERSFDAHAGAIASLDFTDDGSRIVSASLDGATVVWDVDASQELLRLQHGATQAHSVVSSPDASSVASALGSDTVEQAVAVVWDADTGEETLVLTGHLSYPQALATWDPTPGAELLQAGVAWGYVSDVVYAPDGGEILTSGDDGTIRRWDAQRGDELSVWSQAIVIESIAVHPTGSIVVSTSIDGLIMVWQADTGELVATLEGHAGSVRDATFTPEGDMPITAGDDGTVRMWRVPD